MSEARSERRGEPGRHTPQAAVTLPLAAGTKPAPPLQPGTRFGDYVLLEQIGEGGMGVVFRARQTGRVERDVAIKFLRPGLVSDEQLARFEMEQRALASLSHPGIAVVFDAGRLPEVLGGLPFLVMEWLDQGVPITDCCDASYGVPERLALLAQVCDAVQHAHIRGIVHRDLKPANVLVDDRRRPPIVKVIDFGLARPLANRAGTPEITQVGTLLGTPSSMSPEQLDGASGVIDTRTDVYALGCILYELLTGTTPHRFESRPELSIQEMEAAIRDEVVAAPSQRVASCWREPARDRRNAAPRFRPGDLRREPDWICMRALAKDPEQRYASVDALARDLRQCVAGLPVAAGPKTVGYRASAWVRRHRALVAAGVLGVLGLLGGLASLVVGLDQAGRQAERAAQAEASALQAAAREKLRADEAERAREVTRSVTDFLTDVLGAADPAGGNVEITIPEALVRAVAKAEEKYGEDPEQLSEILGTAGRTMRRIGREEDAMRALRRRFELLEAAEGAARLDAGWASADQRVEARNDLAIGLKHTGDIEGAVGLYREALALAEEHGLAQRCAVLTMNLAIALEDLGRIEEAVEHCERSRRLHELAFPDSPERTAIVGARVSSLLHELGKYQESIDVAELVIATFREVYAGKPHPYLANALTLIASPAMRLEQFERAATSSAEAIAIYEQVYGDDHPALMVLLSNQARILRRLERAEEAFEVSTRGLRIAERRGESADAMRAEFLRQRADALFALERYAEAEELAVEAVGFVEASGDREVARSMALTRTILAECLSRQARPEEAEAAYRRAWQEASADGGSSRSRQAVAGRFATFLELHERADEAAEWRARAESGEER